MRWVCLALACVVACSGSTFSNPDGKPSDGKPGDSGPDPNDGARSGSRLKITYWAFADGTRAWNAFYDAQRKEACNIAGPWTDGSYYCTPASNSSIVWQAGCTTKVAMVYTDPSCPQPPPGYVVDYDNTCALTYTHLYTRGAQLGMTAYYYKNTDGSCGGPYSTTNESYYALGSEVAPSNLVKLAVGAPTGASTLSERYVTSSDGMQFPWTVHDATLGADCYLSSYDPSGASAVCLPSAAYAGYNHDAQCAVPELSVTKTCGAPQYAEYFPYTACPSDPPKYFTVGATVASSPLYYESGGVCYTTTADPSSTYYATSQQLTPASVARAPDTLASHRVQLIHDTTTDGLRVRDYSLYDQQLGAECYLTTTPDGTTRCLTFGADIETFYKDSACTQAIDLALVSTGPAACGAPTPPKYGSKFITPPPGSCGYSYEVHPLAAAYAGTVYQNNRACAVFNTSLNQDKLYTIGAAIDPTTFALGTAVTDQ